MTGVFAALLVQFLDPVRWILSAAAGYFSAVMLARKRSGGLVVLFVLTAFIAGLLVYAPDFMVRAGAGPIDPGFDPFKPPYSAMIPMEIVDPKEFIDVGNEKDFLALVQHVLERDHSCRVVWKSFISSSYPALSTCRIGTFVTGWLSAAIMASLAAWFFSRRFRALC
nr:hypothetical protein [Rhizobium sp. ACO-34A]